MADPAPKDVYAPQAPRPLGGLPSPAPAGTRWLSPQALGGRIRDAALHSWLSTQGLLTARIREAAGEGFAMRCLREGTVGTDHVRETVMYCDGVVWMFAHTRIPAETLQRHPWMARIGDRTLGEVLAARQDVQRGAFRYAALPADSWLADRALRYARLPGRPLWVRHSPFTVGGSGFDLYEVFLPDIGQPRAAATGGSGHDPGGGAPSAGAR